MLRQTLSLLWASVAASAMLACQADISDRGGIFSEGAAARYCAATLDDASSASETSLRDALEQAKARGAVVHLYAHRPGGTVSQARLDWMYATAAELSLPFVTYPQLATTQGAAIALSFDDAAIDAWHDQRAQFDAHGVRATFFVTRYPQFSDQGRAKLAELYADGHAVEAHSVHHENAYDYVERWGLAAYMREEAIPSIEHLRNDGYPVSVYAYPFGARSEELDTALLEHVSAVRSIVYAYEPSNDPCN